MSNPSNEPLRYSAGIATAYGAAVKGGYTGTYAAFCEQQAHFAENAAAAQAAARAAEASETAAAASESASAASAQAAGASAHRWLQRNRI